MVPGHVFVNTVEFLESREFHDSKDNYQLFQVSLAYYGISEHICCLTLQSRSVTTINIKKAESHSTAYSPHIKLCCHWLRPRD
jgi:hypothetical protein